jgi:hypothetical protein
VGVAVVAGAFIALLEIVVGIERLIPLDAVADFKILGHAPAAIDHVVRIARSRRVARAHAGAKKLLARIGQQGQLARQNVDELVVERVPMAQRRLSTRAKRDQVDAEARQPAGVAQPSLDTVTHAAPERFRVGGSTDRRDLAGVGSGKRETGHRAVLH